MKRIIFILSLFLLLGSGNAQNIKGLSDQICDSIKNHKVSNADTMFYNQLDIYEKIVSGHLIEIAHSNIKDFKNQANILNYKLIRELIRNCPENLIKEPTLLPFTEIFDLDSIFTISQNDSLSSLINEIKTKKNVQIMVMEVDELFPFENILDLSIRMLKIGNIGSYSSKGGVIIVFSKALRELRISTTEVAKNYLNDSECQMIIDEIVIPDFKSGLYFQGIYESLKAIKKKM